MGEADVVAAQNYLNTQAPIETAWSRALGLKTVELERETALLAFSDTLSLALCGELKAPLDLEAPGRDGSSLAIRVTSGPAHPFEFVVSPWPFRTNELVVEGQARPLPAADRLSDKGAMRTWLTLPERVNFSARLAPA